MMATLLLRLRIARHEGGVHLVLVIVIVRQRGVDLGQCQVRILLDDLRRTVTVGHVIRDNVNHSMACPVDARHPPGGDGDVRIDHRQTSHRCLSAVRRTRFLEIFSHGTRGGNRPVALRTGSVTPEAIWRMLSSGRLSPGSWPLGGDGRWPKKPFPWSVVWGIA